MSTTYPDVTPEDIPKHWHGDVEDLGDDYLKEKLGEVVDMIHSRYGTIVQGRLRSGKLTVRLFKAVVVRIASRVWSNLDGFKKENEGGYGYEVNVAVGSGTLWFTDDDVLDLTGTHPNPKKRTGFTLGTANVGRHRIGRGW